MIRKPIIYLFCILLAAPLWSLSKEDVLKDLSSEDYQVRKAMIQKLKSIETELAKELITVLKQSDDPELRRHIPALQDRLNGFDQFTKAEQQIIKQRFTTESKIVDNQAFYAIFPGAGGTIIEIANVRVFIKGLMISRTIRTGRRIAITGQANLMQSMSYRLNNTTLKISSGRTGSEILINNYKLKIQDSKILLADKSTLIDKQKKVILTDLDNKSHRVFKFLETK